MHLLSVKNLSFSWGYKPLLNQLSFDLDSGRTIGIAGPNGCGKSTLINIIRGITAPDQGQVTIAAHAKLAAVSQEPDFGSAQTIRDYLLADIRPLAARLAELESTMANCGENAKLAHIMAEYGAAQEKFLAAGGYSADAQAENLLGRTGLTLEPDQPLSTLSGGERSILTIVQALVADPEILVLDEPGNHLDYVGLAWLENFLGQLDKGILLISHNRFLLDRCADSIVYLEAGRHWIHRGGYSSFRETRQADLIRERQEYAQRERELHELNIELKDLQCQAAQSYNPPPRVMIALGVAKKKIAGLREIQDRGLTPVARGIRIKLNAEVPKGDNALLVQDLSLSYGSRTVLNQATFRLHRGDRVALVGLNGSGKSSLIRVIRQEAGPDNPQIRLAASQKVGYLSQQTPFPDLSRSLIDEVRGWGALSADAAYNLISPFAFPYSELGKPLSALSGGELQRLQLALLTYRKVNFLILDEPSNHLDIPGREALEACLAEFAGTMLIVSHDRYFLDSFARRVLHLENGIIREYHGNFSEFLAVRLPPMRTPRPPQAGAQTGRGAFLKTPAKADNSAVGAKADLKPGFLHGAPTEPKAGWEAQIQALEAEITRSSQAIMDCRQNNPGLAARLQENLDRKRQELEKLYEQWLADMEEN